MNAGTVGGQRLWEGVTLIKAKLVSSILQVFPWRPSPEGGRENGPPCHSVLLISELSGRNNHSRNSFYTGRRVTSASAVFFFNVNIFNFFQESFPSNLFFGSLLPILLCFLQIRSSWTNPPMAFMVSLGCSVAYYLTLTAKFMFPGFASQFGVLVSLFGSLAVATLISMTLQLPWWFILFILTFIGAFL